MGRWAGGVVLLSMALLAGRAEARDAAGVSFPEQVEVEGKTLSLNGAAVQTKFIFRVYALALYLERPTREADQALHPSVARRIRLRLLHDASRDQMVGALRHGFESNAPRGMTDSLRSRFEQVLAQVGDMRSGDDIVITYVPGKGTTFFRTGSELTVEGDDFAEAMFAIWLGRESSIQSLKQQLLGG